MSKADSEGKITRIQLCGAKGCCPTVEIHHGSDKVVITDDDGGKVTLTRSSGGKRSPRSTSTHNRALRRHRHISPRSTTDAGVSFFSERRTI